MALVCVLVGVGIMWRWASAYYLFSKTLREILNDVDVGPFGEHVEGVANFVRYCAHSHVLMAARDLAMVVFMVWPNWYARAVCVVVLAVTLVPLIRGGEYSQTRARRLAANGRSMNEYIKAVQALGRRAVRG